MYTFSILFGFVALLTLALLIINRAIAGANPYTAKLSSYECGFDPLGDARAKFSVQFFLVAILFIVFDLEVVMLFPLAVTLYQVSTYGFWVFFIFITVLTIGLAYELSLGVLKFTKTTPRGDTPPESYKESPGASRLVKFGIIFFILFFIVAILSANVVFCEGYEDLPSIMQFDNLHLTENYANAVKSLKGSSGVYCIVNQETGAMYIGSSNNLGRRLTNHIAGEGSNAHLQFALIKYGLALFIFSVIELVPKDQLLQREQIWLDWLFGLAKSFRYNFLPLAGSAAGYKHTQEAKDKMSAANSGPNHYNYGKSYSDERRAQIGAASLGHIAPNRLAVSVYTLEGVLVQEYPSYTAAAAGLGVSKTLIYQAIKQGYVVKKMYRVYAN